jgi:small subunit ribosomal protein S11
MLEKQWVLAESHRPHQHSKNIKTMGKKHIIETNQEELIKEQEKINKTVEKDARRPEDRSTVSSHGGSQGGKIYISSSYNNTILTLTNLKGQVLAWKSAGSVGFKGTKKSTSFAASRVAETIANSCKKLGVVDRIEILVKGIGAGRESAVRTLIAQGLNIISIKDITPIPHNGCRPKKVRRV